MTAKTYYKIVKKNINKGEVILGRKLFQRFMLRLAYRWWKHHRKIGYENNAIAEMVSILSYYIMGLSGRVVLANMEIACCKDGPGKAYVTIGRLGNKRDPLALLHNAKMQVEERTVAAKHPNWGK